MGRYNTGAWTIWDARTIELSLLLKRGYLLNNSITSGILNWSRNGLQTGSISFSINTIVSDPFIEFSYTITDREGQKKECKYQVKLFAKNSNLGKGHRWYFVCPFSGKYCSILYMAYGSHYFKAREAYKFRIYYDSQIQSKGSRIYKIFDYESKLLELCKKSKKSHYQGKSTRLLLRIERLQEKTNNYLNNQYSF